MAGTKIQWATDVWNPTTGCDRVSPGCANCYALTMAKRLKAMGHAHYQRDGDPRTSGPGFGLSVHPGSLDLPFRWRKPRLVFVNSMSDLFHEEIPDTLIAEVFDVMRRVPRHTFQVLTKRPERARDWFERFAPAFGRFRDGAWPLPNVWLGVSIENARFTWRADVLREIPAAVRFISAEPLLGSLFNDSSRERAASQAGTLARKEEGPRSPTPSNGGRDDQAPGMGARTRAPLDLTGIDWVIIGGESGPRARPFYLEHAREIILACRSVCWGCREGLDTFSFDGAPGHDENEPCIAPAVFVKQLGAKPTASPIPGEQDWPLNLRDRKGGDMSEWPADLRIREFPRSAVPA